MVDDKDWAVFLRALTDYIRNYDADNDDSYMRHLRRRNGRPENEAGDELKGIFDKMVDAAVERKLKESLGDDGK